MTHPMKQPKRKSAEARRWGRLIRDLNWARRFLKSGETDSDAPLAYRLHSQERRSGLEWAIRFVRKHAKGGGE